MSPAEKMWADAFGAVRAFFNQPSVKAYYAAQAKRRAAEIEREQLEAREKREAAEADRVRVRAYDAYVLSGGGNECIRFGINDGCKPWCPVFERGQCEVQAENAAAFAAEGLQ